MLRNFKYPERVIIIDCRLRAQDLSQQTTLTSLSPQQTVASFLPSPTAPATPPPHLSSRTSHQSLLPATPVTRQLTVWEMLCPVGMLPTTPLSFVSVSIEEGLGYEHDD